MTTTDKRLTELESRVQGMTESAGYWPRQFDQMNTFFDATGTGLRWENGNLVNRPELAHPAENRNIEDYE